MTSFHCRICRLFNLSKNDNYFCLGHISLGDSSSLSQFFWPHKSNQWYRHRLMKIITDENEKTYRIVRWRRSISLENLMDMINGNEEHRERWLMQLFINAEKPSKFPLNFWMRKINIKCKLPYYCVRKELKNYELPFLFIWNKSLPTVKVL